MVGSADRNNILPQSTIQPKHINPHNYRASVSLCCTPAGGFQIRLNKSSFRVQFSNIQPKKCNLDSRLRVDVLVSAAHSGPNDKDCHMLETKARDLTGLLFLMWFVMGYTPSRKRCKRNKNMLEISLIAFIKHLKVMVWPLVIEEFFRNLGH